jgi:transposase
VRVTTAFNRLLRLPGASVTDVSFDHAGVVVTVRLRRRRRVCSRCGQTGRLAIHDRRLKRWRHLDLGAQRCIIECELRRLWCRSCGAQFEAVPWARAGSRYTRDFEDTVAWLAQQMAKTPIAGLLRIAWETIGPIVERVIAERLDERRLERLVCIGVDEISYRRHHRYLTSVVDHRAGAIVWCAPGRNAATLQGFFDELGEHRHTIRAISIDMSGATGRWIKHTRWSLLKAPDKQSIPQLALLGEVATANKALYRAFLLKEQLRLLYQLNDHALAPAHLDAWLAWASRSRLRPFVRLARTIRAHRAGILAAIRLGLTNGRLEGLNSRIRLISHRSFGFHSAAPLIALIYLCCGGVVIDLPLR